jgi:membrane protein implicated in regulation of membrane protease activity
MNRVGDDLLLQSLERQEDYIQTAADAIDVKAGLILAAAAFLAVQPAVLLIAPNIPKCAFVAQLLSFLILSFAVGLAHWTLRVEGYAPPGFDEAWRDQQIAAAKEGALEEDVKKTILWGLIEQAKGRITKGRQLNDSKLTSLGWARGLTTASFAINLLIVVTILVMRLS